MYIVMTLNTEIQIEVLGMNKKMDVCYADGMIGVIPVFKTKKAAKKFGGKRFGIMEVEITPSNEKETK